MKKDDVYEELKEVAGPDAAKRLVEYYKGEKVYFPKRIVKKLRNQEIRKEFENKKTYRELAIRYELSERNIRRIVAKKEQSK